MLVVQAKGTDHSQFSSLQNTFLADTLRNKHNWFQNMQETMHSTIYKFM